MSATFPHYVVLEVPNITSNQSFVGVFRGLSGLEISFDVLDYREGGNNNFVHRLPGRMSYPNLVLSFGFINDDALFQWFLATQQQAQTQQITLTLTAAQGDNTNIRKFVFGDAFPVHWSGPGINATMVDPQSWNETLEIAHSGLVLP
jgi:phage tail-like protein